MSDKPKREKPGVDFSKPHSIKDADKFDVRRDGEALKSGLLGRLKARASPKEEAGEVRPAEMASDKTLDESLRAADARGNRPRSTAFSEAVDFSDPKHDAKKGAQHFKMSDKETLLATFKGIGDRMKKAASPRRSSPASEASSVSPMGTPTSLDSPKKGSGFVKG